MRSRLERSHRSARSSAAATPLAATAPVPRAARGGAALAWAVTAVITAGVVSAQAPAKPTPVELPKEAATLEGQPSVRVDTSETATTRTLLTPTEAAEHRLSIQVKDGRVFWASQGNRPLTVESADGYTYLSSGPGRYIRLTRLNDKISYVEHLDMAPGNVTFWGELKIAIGR